jgi:L-asparaginase
MRTSNDEHWDGPRNLLDAATVAASRESAGRGTMVVFHGKVFSGRTAVKTHATNPDAFSAPHAAPVGQVRDGRVLYREQTGRQAARQISHLRPSSLSARVALVPMVVGDDGSMLDRARADHDGVVIEAFGSGNLPPGAVPAISRWIGEDKPVVLATRCPTGVVTPTYAFEGGGARTVAMGVIPAGPRVASQAWMELMIALSAGTAYGN